MFIHFLWIFCVCVCMCVVCVYMCICIFRLMCVDSFLFTKHFCLWKSVHKIVKSHEKLCLWPTHKQTDWNYTNYPNAFWAVLHVDPVIEIIPDWLYAQIVRTVQWMRETSEWFYEETFCHFPLACQNQNPSMNSQAIIGIRRRLFQFLSKVKELGWKANVNQINPTAQQ